MTLIPLYKGCIPACFWLLEYLSTNKTILIEIILDNSFSEFRSQFAKLLQCALIQVFKAEESYLDKVKSH